MKGEQSSELRRCLRSHREQGDPPGAQSWESRKGVIPGEVAASRAARAARDLAGIPGVDNVATKALRTPVEGGPGIPAVAPLGSPARSHHVRPAPPRQLTQRRQTRTPAAEGDRGARVPGLRAHAGRPRPACPLAPYDWQLKV